MKYGYGPGNQYTIVFRLHALDFVTKSGNPTVQEIKESDLKTNILHNGRQFTLIKADTAYTAHRPSHSVSKSE